MEKVQSFEHACEIEGLNPEKVIHDFAAWPESDRNSMQAYSKIVIMARAANRLANDGELWVADYDDNSQRKHELLFRKDSLGFRVYDYARWSTYSHIGSRLCFISREVGIDLAERFPDLFNEWLS